MTLTVKRIYSQAASLCGPTPNNCFAVYQKELALLLIQASPTHYLMLFATITGDLLNSVKIRDLKIY